MNALPAFAHTKPLLETGRRRRNNDAVRPMGILSIRKAGKMSRVCLIALVAFASLLTLFALTRTVDGKAPDCGYDPGPAYCITSVGYWEECTDVARCTRGSDCAVGNDYDLTECWKSIETFCYGVQCVGGENKNCKTCVVRDNQITGLIRTTTCLNDTCNMGLPTNVYGTRATSGSSSSCCLP